MFHFIGIYCKAKDLRKNIPMPRINYGPYSLNDLSELITQKFEL